MPIRRVTVSTIKVLEQLIIAPEPIWGLELVRRTGLKTGTVYPILERLEEASWLYSTWEIDDTRNGPRRRLYTLTKTGFDGANSLLTSQSRTKPHVAKVRGRATKPLEA